MPPLSGSRYEPQHFKNNKLALCGQGRLRSACTSAQSDQSLLCAQWLAKDPMFLHADREDSYQPGLTVDLLAVGLWLIYKKKWVLFHSDKNCSKKQEI